MTVASLFGVVHLPEFRVDILALLGSSSTVPTPSMRVASIPADVPHGTSPAVALDLDTAIYYHWCGTIFN